MWRSTDHGDSWRQQPIASPGGLAVDLKTGVVCGRNWKSIELEVDLARAAEGELRALVTAEDGESIWLAPAAGLR